MKHIPNFITSLNLVSGFIAILFAANGNLVSASWFILAAMIFDFLDGLTARLLKAYSEIGKELDSLADVVSFGVAPGIIVFQLLNNSLSLNNQGLVNADGITASSVLLFSAIMPVCGAFRLAKFNIDTTQKMSFKGLPVPANALAVISVIIANHYSQSQLMNSFTGSPLLLILFTTFLSLLMVSRVPLLSLKISSFRFRGNEGRYILFCLVLIFFGIFGILAFPLIIPLYIISSAISLLF